MAYCMSENALQNGNRHSTPSQIRNGISSKQKNKTLLYKFSDQIDKIKSNFSDSVSVSGQRFDARYKIVMLGESGVGKTSLIRATTGETFIPTMISTIGIDFVYQNLEVENKIIQLQLWDTAGQERYRSLTTSSFRDAKGFVIVYDITNKASFSRLREDWLRMTDIDAHDPVPIFFVGNKVDLGRLREVAKSDAEKMTRQQYAHGFFETSARTGHGVKDLFRCVATCMLTTWGVHKLDCGVTQPSLNAITLGPNDEWNHRRKDSSTNCCNSS